MLIFRRYFHYRYATSSYLGSRSEASSRWRGRTFFL